MAGGANRFLGWQVTAFGVNPELDYEDVLKYANIKGFERDYDTALFPTTPGSDMREEIQKDISIAPNNKNKSNFLSLYKSGINITKHDITQLNNIDFVGNNSEYQFFNGEDALSRYTSSMTIARNGETDLGATVTISQAVPDKVFMDDTEPKDIPVIGATVFLIISLDYGALPRVVYIITPTVVDATGHIVELTH